MDESLIIENVHFGYKGGPTLFNGVYLKVHSGEVVGIIGPNGAGKTTLIGLSSGQYRPIKGCIRVHGVDMRSLKPIERARHIACLPQGNHIDGAATVFDVIMSGRRPYRTFGGYTSRDEEIALVAAKRLSVESWLDRPYAHLSGGERQRVALSRVIAQKTSIVLCDEPATSLDPKYLWSTFRLIRDVSHDDGVAVLVSIHDLSVACSICDRVVLVAQGHILYDGLASALSDRDLSSAYQTQVRSIQTSMGRFYTYPEEPGQKEVDS